ncbi:MAG: TonB-dependent receptor [Steroidobacteraceae bacterium]|jgi:iron complex outermembrane recepter protein
MRIARSTLIGTAVAMALSGGSTALHAQTVVQPPSDGALPAQAAADQAAKPADLQEVVVTGIRYSMEQSIAQKRAASNVTEVVTAEDIGKMPDKNIADALQRLPGVTISSSGANEGGFDEADRVSCRGTNPSLAQTTIDGHMVASGDWFVLDQTGTVGRSVSYTLLPAELVKEVVVNMSSEASFLEGGVACNVDIHTRDPLDFQKSQTLEASAGAVYANLPATTDPQFNALGNWLNDSRNFGVLLQLFYEQRHEERQGQELLGYSQIGPCSQMVTGIIGGGTLLPGGGCGGTPTLPGNANFANVWYPDLIGSALFQQERKRGGGLLKAEWQANDNVLVDASGFLSRLSATNVNDNYLWWGNNIVNGGNGQNPGSAAACAAQAAANGGVIQSNGCAASLGLQPGYKIVNGTLTNAQFAAYPGTNYGVYDQISRPGEGSDTNFGNIDIHVTATDHLKFLGELGVTTGHGLTPTQDVSETLPGVGAGAGYTLNGITSAANWNLGNAVNTTPTPGGVPVAFSWIFGDQNMDVLDKETYGKIDGTFTLDDSTFTDFKFGVRYADHQRHLWGVIGQGPNFAVAGSTSPSNYPTGYQNYPTAFGNGLGGNFPTNIWYWTPAQLAAYDDAFTNRDPVSRADWTSDYGLEEKDAAAYVQADFKGSNWSGNIGVRFVSTKESVINDVGVNVPNPAAPPPGVITTSAFGPYTQVTTDNTYNDILPSANLKVDLTPDLVGRFAASQTMARPDYSALAGSTSLGAPPPTPTSPPGSATGSNPNLKPVISTDLDAGLEWYFAPKSLLSATAFYMDLHNYISYGTIFATYKNFNVTYPNGFPAPYDVTVPVNADGRVYGAEFQYLQPITENFGVSVNYTYADGVQTSQVSSANGTGDTLVGTSKNTYNLTAYYETSRFSARVAYTFRSAFYSGLDRSTAFFQDDIGTLAASLGYQVNDAFSITLDGMNLNNPTLKYYALNTDQPRAFYKNGSQYYLNFRFKL